MITLVARYAIARKWMPRLAALRHALRRDWRMILLYEPVKHR